MKYKLALNKLVLTFKVLFWKTTCLQKLCDYMYPPLPSPSANCMNVVLKKNSVGVDILVNFTNPIITIILGTSEGQSQNSSTQIFAKIISI